MSLINQMLSDLDQRQAAGMADTSAAFAAPFISSTGIINKNIFPVFKIGFYIFALMLLSITSYYSYSLYQQQPTIIKQTVAANTPTIKPSHIAPIQMVDQPQTLKNKHHQNKTTKKIQKIDSSITKTITVATITPAIPNNSDATNQFHTALDIEETIQPINNDINAVKKQQRQLNSSQQAELAYQKGYQLLQQNKIYSAEAKLLLALEHDAKHINAREMLVGLYLKAGRKVEAEGLLNKGLLHLPNYSNFAKLRARILLDNNQVNKAVKTLLKHKPTLLADPNFYALLAASYQRQNNHAAAANTYVKLLKINPREGIWWVGMAISLEALNKDEQARDAYEKARQTGTLNTRITNYSNQRFKILNSTNSAP